jgi:hypothetical protein
MSNANPEPPALAAEREKLMAELQKQAKTATGPTQTVLKKLYEVLAQTRPGAPANPQVFTEAKAAFEQFSKAPVASPPPVIMQTLEFMQKRSAAMPPAPAPAPKSAPPPSASPAGPRAPIPGGTFSGASSGGPPPRPSSAGGSFASGPPRGAPAPRRSTMDGFEAPQRTSSAVSLKPPSAGAADPGKKADQPGAAPGKPKIPGDGKVRG